MALQVKLTNRRQFLGRSALGAGSLLFGPLLLESCMTDHVIPNPPLGPPSIPVYDPSAAYSIDWSDALKTVTVAGLSEVPVVGGFLSPLADILWPSTQEDVWGQIKDQVQALINKDIDATVYSLVSAQLDGLKNNIVLYNQALRENDPANTTTVWLTTRGVFAGAKGFFQNKDYALLLLPLFVQYATLYLSLLRDPVIWGKYASFHGANSFIQFNRTDAEFLDDVSNLQNAIIEFTNYTNDTYNNAFLNLPGNTDFTKYNAFNRQMILTVFDYMDTWQYYDYLKYPYGAVDQGGTALNTMPREIYSDAYGEFPGSIAPPFPSPTGFPKHITVWGYDRIDAVQVFYPDDVYGNHTGPLGQPNTPRMGDQSGGQNFKYGGEFDTDINNKPYGPITQARARGYQFVPMRNEVPCVYTLQFMYNNGTVTNQCGGANLNDNTDQAPNNWVSYPNHALSSVYIPGVSSYRDIGSANCIIFGFKYWQAPATTLNAARVLYVKSPQEKSAADYAKAFPKLPIPADLITDELKEIRKKYWEWMKARAAKLK